MSPGRGTAAVVVGVDGPGSAGDAVEWAAAEAAARGCPLRIVHAFHPPLPADPYGVTPVDGMSAAQVAAECVVRDAVTRARSVASDIEVSTRLLLGTAVRVLLHQSRTARLLVLGSRGLRGLRGLLARSVSVRVVTHATCPVVVIRPSKAVRGPSLSSPRVVVGVDRTSFRTPAVGFALQAARQRGIPLVVVHAWTPDPPADLEMVCGPPQVAEAHGRRLLERALDACSCESTGVAVVRKLVLDEPGHALVAESAGAALVVVGSGWRGHLGATAFGSVRQSVLDHGHCPVAVVHEGGGVTPEPPAWRGTDTAPRA